MTRLPAVLDQIDLIDPDPPVRILAQTVQPAIVRSLDAIHLGTALHARHALTSTVARATGSPEPYPAMISLPAEPIR